MPLGRRPGRPACAAAPRLIRAVLERRRSLDELVEYFVAGWHAVADLIPSTVLGNITGLPLAGPSHVDLIMSAATPADLIFRRAVNQNLSGGGIIRGLAAEAGRIWHVAAGAGSG
jgi:hypothetical protein